MKHNVVGEKNGMVIFHLIVICKYLQLKKTQISLNEIINI